MSKKRTGPKDPAAMEMVRKRLRKLSPERRREIARNAANARWSNTPGRKD
jgi:hypothetical protein